MFIFWFAQLIDQEWDCDPFNVIVGELQCSGESCAWKSPREANEFIRNKQKPKFHGVNQTHRNLCNSLAEKMLSRCVIVISYLGLSLSTVSWVEAILEVIQHEQHEYVFAGQIRRHSHGARIKACINYESYYNENNLFQLLTDRSPHSVSFNL